MTSPEYESSDSLSALIKTQASRYDAPADLRAQIRASLARAEPPQVAATTQRPRKPWSQWFKSQWFNTGAAFACGLIVAVAATWLMPQFNSSDRVADRLAEEVVSSHVRSMMVAHLSDVVSTDHHTVKPWFAGKLDFSPPVHDLAKEGFALSGGRLDYIAQRPVAALVYQRNQHTINLFVWPASAELPTQPPQSRQGFNIAGWADAGMQFWAVSDISADELTTFAQLLRSKKQ